MPYGISDSQPGCDGWATVKQTSDGYDIIGCHETKAEAIDQMVAAAGAEQVEILGEIRAEMIEIEEDLEIEEVEEIGEEAGEAESEPVLTPRQEAMYETYEAIVERFGMWNQGAGADGAHYVVQSPFADGGMICANCAFYEGGQRCEIVEGRIAPAGICKLWVIEEQLLVAEPQEQIIELESRIEPNLQTPVFMAESARRGLELHEQGFSGDGLMPATVADARRMANGEALSESKWRRIGPWIARHIGDLDAVGEDEITPGLVAMLLWGGGSSRASARRTQEYAERIVTRLDEQEKRFDEDQPRDETGKWTSGGGGGVAGGDSGGGGEATGGGDSGGGGSSPAQNNKLAEAERIEAIGHPPDENGFPSLDDPGTGAAPDNPMQVLVDSRAIHDAGMARFASARDAQIAEGLDSDDLPLEAVENALHAYTGSEYSDINDSLRQTQDPSDDMYSEGVVGTLDEAIANAPPLAADTIVYRGVTFKNVGMENPSPQDIKRQEQFVQGLRNLEAGDTLTDYGFVSTSFIPTPAVAFAGGLQSKGMTFRIKVPEGTRAVVPDAFKAGVKSEYEMILARGSSFRVVNNPGNGVIDLELVTDE